MRRKNDTSPVKNFIKTLPVAFGVMALFYVAMLIKDIDVPVIQPVNDIRVEGELRFLDEHAIVSTVKNNIAESYFAVDLVAVREILMREPWIKEVSLRRKWPADITVYIEERRPIAYWNDDGYISETGDVFKPDVLDKELKLPYLNGPESQHVNVLKFMNALYKDMALLNYAVKRLVLDDRRAWELVIENLVADNTDADRDIINVKLGRSDTDKRLHRFVRILPALSADIKLTDNKIKIIDMRYPNGFAVQMMKKQKLTEEQSARNDLPMNNLLMNNNSHDFVSARHHATVQMSRA